ncbi:single-stranded DNA-binding protein [Bifidobacterium simiarum]|uniref:single-stranded DNA-binding protein n=1 Tax=Bifidobacterium simiarum TaxID=2045441 RepID=UPI001BDCF3AC|nr:hypothetical protein [Bifidobacterium simiarum]MBT1167254.1 hypothetical protein [Bifidobacterium simiarum]
MTTITEPVIKTEGNIGRDPIYRAGTNGRRSFAAIRVLKSERRYNPDTRAWEDTGTTLAVTLKAFGATADLIGALIDQGRLAKGTPIMATGQPDAPETWTDRQGGVHADPVVIIDAIGIDLIRQARAEAARTRQNDQATRQPSWPATPAAAGEADTDGETVPGWSTEPSF